MAKTGDGYIKLNDGQIVGRIMRASLYETRKSGLEFAVADTGLILFPTAYEYEAVYEVASEADQIDVNRLMRDIEAAR